MLLADMGAEVVRIDRIEPEELGTQSDPKFNLLNRSRRSVRIDLKHPQGIAAVGRLAATADVVVEGYRPGVMERLGLGPAACQERNPRLIYGRMTGWGQEGPLAGEAGHDINYIALAGALDAIGPADGDPVVPLNLVGDFGGGALYLALGILAAVIERHSSGRGQVVDASMLDGTHSLLSAAFGAQARGEWRDRGRNAIDGAAPWYAVYRTADGKYVSVGAIEARFYRQLLVCLGLASEDLPEQHDRSGWPLLRSRFSAVFASRTRDEWCATMDGANACFAPVLDLDETRAHAQSVHRHAFVDVAGISHPAPAPRFSRTPSRISRPPACPGEHTEEVLRDCGFSAAEILSLRACRAIN
jgi:alpha-methylacyl-CoA racemase